LNTDLPSNYINSLIKLNDNSILASTKKDLAQIVDGIVDAHYSVLCTTYPDNDAKLLLQIKNVQFGLIHHKKCIVFMMVFGKVMI
jgi:hypothetical protein